jgi:outer membrane lipoprotein-sorting protein
MRRLFRRDPNRTDKPLPMSRLRTLSSRRLAAIAAAVTALAVTAGIAQAELGSGPKPEPKPLDQAIHDAVNAPEVAGVSARISFTNGLIPAGAIGGEEGSPLTSGADGRLWLAADGRFRLELQSDAGDAQITSDGTWITVVDASSDIVYRIAQPTPEKVGADHAEPSLAGIRRGLERLGEAWTLSGAQPSSTADRPSYTVRIAPKDDGGLLGAGELAWDADKGVPLRAAVYAQGQTDPVLELEATEISYGAIDEDDLRIEPPAGAAVVEIEPPAGAPMGRGGKDVRGVDAVQRELDFELAAPDELAGLPRRQLRLVRLGGRAGALATYGEGLGGLIVLQHRAIPRTEEQDTGLPQINIDGATGTELATALGTMVRFERDGVAYTVVGSVPPTAAENAARDLR